MFQARRKEQWEGAIALGGFPEGNKLGLTGAGACVFPNSVTQ